MESKKEIKILWKDVLGDVSHEMPNGARIDFMFEANRELRVRIEGDFLVIESWRPIIIFPTASNSIRVKCEHEWGDAKNET